MQIVRNGVVVAVLAFSVSGFSQTAQTSSQTSLQPQTTASMPSSTQKSTSRIRQRDNTPPCWKQAGLTAAMVNQRWKIEDDGRVKIAEVCDEVSLTPQQKHDKIEQVNAETDQAIAKLIPSKQLEMFNSCQAEMNEKHPKPAGQRELGPCGGVLPSSTVAAPHEHH